MHLEIANKNNFVFSLIHELAPHFVNVGGNRLKNTFILGPYFSACVGFEVIEDKLCIGLPAIIFDIMKDIRFFSLSYIPDHSGLFFVVDFGVLDGSAPLAFRIYLRQARVNLLSEFEDAHIVRLNQSGIFDLSSRHDVFTITLRKERGLPWEKY